MVKNGEMRAKVVANKYSECSTYTYTHAYIFTLRTHTYVYVFYVDGGRESFKDGRRKE